MCFPPCEMQSFNFPGGELEGPIDGQMCAHVDAGTNVIIKPTVIQQLIWEGVSSLLFVPDSWDRSYLAT